MNRQQHWETVYATKATDAVRVGTGCIWSAHSR